MLHGEHLYVIHSCTAEIYMQSVYLYTLMNMQISFACATEITLLRLRTIFIGF